MTQASFDPLALWRDMLSQWEANFNEVAGKNIASPEFMAELMGRYLSALNMPSRSDLAAINERLQKIEEQLARLTPEPSSAPANGPTAETSAAARRVAKKKAKSS